VGDKLLISNLYRLSDICLLFYCDLTVSLFFIFFLYKIPFRCQKPWFVTVAVGSAMPAVSPNVKINPLKKKICSLIHSFEKKSATKRILFRKLEFQKSLIQLHEQRWIICLSLAILNSIQRVDLCLITEKE